ncbi:hypothetical protein [Moorena sp. SIO4G3]|uniref:hypothetical protein n=1 Tax=Moorena sp. SIO4G3 TaxID=2607821 RepID=UPI001428E8EA|nr:hypothetical protein [Moorena sp. SIO4G3]NEO78800.1 hypothetical protein [Moorena sp. SIO4G3]
MGGTPFGGPASLFPIPFAIRPMPLSDLQTALGKLIAARASAKCLSSESLGWLDSLKLTPEERTWLEQLIDSDTF